MFKATRASSPPESGQRAETHGRRPRPKLEALAAGALLARERFG